MLTVKNLELSIGGSRILRGVELEVPDHQCFCLMGRNGVGKTSTLRSITGVMKPSAGKITLNGKDITKMSPEARAAPASRMIPISTPRGTFRVWTKRTGTNPDLKVLLLHGGPGASSEGWEGVDTNSH